MRAARLELASIGWKPSVMPFHYARMTSECGELAAETAVQISIEVRVCSLRLDVERVTGIEPAESSMARKRSTKEQHSRKISTVDSARSRASQRLLHRFATARPRSSGSRGHLHIVERKGVGPFAC